MPIEELAKQSSNPEEAIGLDEVDLFEIANLYPDTTGLPMTVWVSPRGASRQDVRVKVNTMHGNHMNVANTAVVGVRPTPRVIAGQLSPTDAQAVFEWVVLNRDTLVEYWDGRIDTARMIRGLKALPSTGRSRSPAP